MVEHNKPTIKKDDLKSVCDGLSSKWIGPGEKVREFELEHRCVVISNKDPERIKKEFLKEGIMVINPLENWGLLHNYLHLNRNDFPNAKQITRKMISVPICSSLTNEEVEEIKKAVDKILIRDPKW